MRGKSVCLGAPEDFLLSEPALPPQGCGQALRRAHASANISYRNTFLLSLAWIPYSHFLGHPFYVTFLNLYYAYIHQKSCWKVVDILIKCCRKDLNKRFWPLFDFSHLILYQHFLELCKFIILFFLPEFFKPYLQKKHHFSTVFNVIYRGIY